MKIRKWLMTSVVLTGMTAAVLPGISASAASIPTDGTGTVIENTTADSASREFFTIKTADGNVFYIVVDKTKTDDNVYLLTPVTEDSLKALTESAAQKNGTTATSGTSNLFGGASTSSETTGAVTSSATTDSGTSAAAKTQKATTAASVGNIAFIAIVAILVFVAAFYFKIYKPKHTPVPESFDEEPDEDDYGENGDTNGDEDEKPPRKPAHAPQKLARADRVQDEQEDEFKPDAREPHTPATPRLRREDVRQENADGTGEPGAEAAQSEAARPAQFSTRTRVGGLFAPDAPSTPEPKQKNLPQASGAGGAKEFEEPEPEPDETEMDYGDGMDAFGNPDEEE